MSITATGATTQFNLVDGQRWRHRTEGYPVRIVMVWVSIEVDTDTGQYREIVMVSFLRWVEDPTKNAPVSTTHELTFTEFFKLFQPIAH